MTACTQTELTQYLRSKICPWCGARLASHHERSEDGRILPMIYTCTECGRNPREALALPYPEPVGQRPRPEGEETMTSKKSRAKVLDTTIETEKPVAVIVSGDGPAPATTGAKPADETPKASKKTKAPAPDGVRQQPDDGAEIVVFAFRMTRAERDELHAATGSARASRFVRAIVLAGARGDMKAIQNLIDEMQGSRK